MYPIFDGHNDTLLDLLKGEKGEPRSFYEDTRKGHLDYPRAIRGGFAGGFFAMYTPNPEPGKKTILTEQGYQVPLAEPISHEYAFTHTKAMAQTLFQLEKESNGRVKVIRKAEELADCIKRGVMAAVYHIEGAEAIDPDFRNLHLFYKEGLRSLGIVWSRPNRYGEGVPFQYPSSPDMGGGLTGEGLRLVKECNRLGIMIDTSHLTEKGFWNTAEVSDAPIVASHSNAHAICAHSRNLTDSQLAAIASSGGVAGINFSVSMLRQDGGRDPDTPLMEIVRHIEYIAEKFGVDHVAFGSDFDGTFIPNEIGDVTGLPKLLSALKARGFRDRDIRKIAYENWQRVLLNTWKEPVPV
ncbi:dipeptidase [Peribacillus sp. SCS-26]|uniref:dipeptidase n=1 Tax=Paraperibacillus marinus TaxID=3115295 RepID=UPI003905B7F7